MNAIAPGYIDTEMVAAVPPNVLEKIVARIPVGRLGKASEIARAGAVSRSAGRGWFRYRLDHCRSMAASICIKDERRRLRRHFTSRSVPRIVRPWFEPSGLTNPRMAAAISLTRIEGRDLFCQWWRRARGFSRAEFFGRGVGKPADTGKAPMARAKPPPCA